MTKSHTRKTGLALGFLVAVFGGIATSPTANAAEVTDRLQPLQEFKIAHCCHPHPYVPYDDYCCHGPSAGYVVPRAYVAPRVYVAPRAYGVGAASVRGTSRRTSRRVSRRR